MSKPTQKDGEAPGANPSNSATEPGENRIAFMLQFDLFDCINLNASIYSVLEMALESVELNDLSPGDAARVNTLVTHSRTISFFITEDLDRVINRKVS